MGYSGICVSRVDLLASSRLQRSLRQRAAKNNSVLTIFCLLITYYQLIIITDLGHIVCPHRFHVYFAFV